MAGSPVAIWANHLAGRLSGRLAVLQGWRRLLALTVLGLLAAAALPPVYALPALPVALTGLLWILSGAGRWRRGFADGWWFGMGYFTGGLYWIANALLVDAAQWAWLIPFAVLCIPAILSLYIGILCAFVRRGATTTRRVFMLGSGWAIAEWLRGQLFTGFPWNPVGSVWVFSDYAIQGAAVFGVLGLGFFTILACAAPATLADRTGPARWRLPAAGAFLVAALFAFGGMRVPPGPVPSVPDVRLRIVQPNIPQRLKWKREYATRHLSTLLRLSRAPGAEPVTHVIWPETAVPFVPSIDENGRRAIARAVPADGLLLTGAIRRTPPGVGPLQIWNSLHAIDASARIVATYDKFHLVPFGEYMPLGELLGLKKLTAGRTDFSAGPGPVTLSIPGLPPASPLICYEIVFADRVTGALDGGRPGWLLNVTNDAWFGDSSGPRQHLVAARLRAVEQGLPVVRSANTGISAVIDPYGRVTGRVGLGQEGIIDTSLPAARRAGVYYPVTGDLPLLFLSAALLLWLARAPLK